MKHYVDSRIANDPHEAIRYLIAFLPTAWSLESGLSHKSGFRADTYKAVVEFASPDSILKALKTLYGESLNSAEYYQPEDMAIEEKVAHQFAFLYRKHGSDAAQPVPKKAATGETPAIE